MYKTDRQIGYKPKNEKSYFNSYTETPFSVGIALDVHTSTRSERMVNKLNYLGISISYKKLLSIENCIAARVVDETKSNKGLYLPPWTFPGKPVWFAIDNVDFMEKRQTV